MKELQVLKEESALDILEKQYQEASNKEEIDYWTPLSKIILESIEIRDSKQMSQADLAEKMKTRQSVISRFENMGRLPNYDFIARLSIALGHIPGMTLYGDYMAVVPNDKQELIKELAEKEKMSTVKYVQNLLEQGINKVSIYKNTMPYSASFPEVLNYKESRPEISALTSVSPNCQNNITLAA